MHGRVFQLRDITHENLNSFIGLCIDSTKPISLWAYCGKGSLEDVLQNHSVKLDWFFKYSLIKDLACVNFSFLFKTNMKIKSKYFFFVGSRTFAEHGFGFAWSFEIQQLFGRCSLAIKNNRLRSGCVENRTVGVYQR